MVSWFQDLTQNPHIDFALLVDSSGKLVATSNRVEVEAQRVAAMIRAAEVLARGLSAELGRGEIRTLQLTTTAAHLLVAPLGPFYYLMVLIDKSAPLELISVYMQRLVERLDEDEIEAVLRQSTESSLDDLDVEELIAAVSEWLHNGGDRR
jgi:predicted regulator of Ras-like GTPase activity (Roadblock/LC7/MglB family)